MTHTFLDGLVVNFVCYHGRSTAMAQIVESNVLQVMLCHEPTPFLSQGVRVIGRTILQVDDVFFLVEAWTIGTTFFIVFLFSGL